MRLGRRAAHKDIKDMKIEDIQKENGKVIITLVNEDVETVLVLSLSEADAWDIHDFCKSKLKKPRQKGLAEEVENLERAIELANLKRAIELRSR